MLECFWKGLILHFINAKVLEEILYKTLEFNQENKKIRV